MMHLKVITPASVVLDKEVLSITVPSAMGEMTILPRHEKLLSLLVEGIVAIKDKEKDDALDYIAIGGGYLETDGKTVSILVSRAYHQDEVDEKLTKEAFEQATKDMSLAKDQLSKQQALALLHRSAIDLKLIKRHRRAPTSAV